ncbi:hypothetical protein B0T18DRAFT_484665 [Schizothecium vesticola]|uniref:Uncharacterized protein n=1 Tax=Schizothecium vesticola TaxID=314040 RepID=A0AA40FAG9_9PEZI|nr:hypothetical protein B0T18DRAFT_484665 [Schizothecium vesticola]
MAVQVRQDPWGSALTLDVVPSFCAVVAVGIRPVAVLSTEHSPVPVRHLEMQDLRTGPSHVNQWHAPMLMAAWRNTHNHARCPRSPSFYCHAEHCTSHIAQQAGPRPKFQQMQREALARSPGCRLPMAPFTTCDLNFTISNTPDPPAPYPGRLSVSDSEILFLRKPGAARSEMAEIEAPSPSTTSPRCRRWSLGG